MENTHNARGGTVLPLSYTQEICAEMHERGVSVPLDGTRIFNAAAALGEPMRSLTESFDSVALNLNKGPCGSPSFNPKAASTGSASSHANAVAAPAPPILEIAIDPL
ncbi:beta-eliminating lyase-related protein [Cohnella phaseoli]|uniref:beta-eliminating lyase-related protein n=1 Tax=Cohnella phaseoli TaxID=456490 RepID=UPI0015F29D65